VFTLIVRITNDRETAEELMLDVFHDVWRRASTYDPAGATVLGWIMNLPSTWPRSPTCTRPLDEAAARARR
jgi:hypothetical protein